ncbi:hypothetical protein ATERTT37_002111 [Aspergillus terreus]
MARTEHINCYCRNREGFITLLGLVEAGFDANIVTRTGANELMSCGYIFDSLDEGKLIRAPGGTIYTGTRIVTAAIYASRVGRRSEDESFYLVDPEPAHLLCDLVLGQDSLISKNLTDNSAAPTVFRPKTDAEKKKQQDEDKKNDEKVRAEQEKVREQKRSEREANRRR